MNLRLLKPIRPAVWILALALLGIISPASAKPRVVLEAAHGGSDNGVRAGSEVEKDWNLKIVQALDKAFEDAGYDVVLIRKKDETLSLENRAEAINASQSSAVIIVHADGEWTGTQTGPVLVVEPPNRGEGAEPGEIQKWGGVGPGQYRSSLKLARDIAQKLGAGSELSSLSDSRGTAGEALAAEGRIYCLPHQSLRYLVRPAVVLTPLYLTSSSDLKKFSKAETLADFAAKVVQGTSAYLQGAP